MSGGSGSLMGVYWKWLGVESVPRNRPRCDDSPSTLSRDWGHWKFVNNTKKKLRIRLH